MYYNELELNRLINAFKNEAAQFHDINFSQYWVTQSEMSENRKFRNPNHSIMLWQTFGNQKRGQMAERMTKAVEESDLQWGVRGAEFSVFGVVEGPTTEKFVRMAQRCAMMFDADSRSNINRLATDEISIKLGESRATDEISIICGNQDPLAIWLNYLLYHVSLSSPTEKQYGRIYPDPYSLSLLALENLRDHRKTGKVDQNSINIDSAEFKVSFSFAGESRGKVSKVAENLKETWGENSLFYDFHFKAQLARANLDLLLQDIYLNRSGLIVVFLSETYEKKDWCGIEWRAIRNIISKKDDFRVMFVKLEEFSLPGLFPNDGYFDATQFDVAEVVSAIQVRAADERI